MQENALFHGKKFEIFQFFIFSFNLTDFHGFHFLKLTMPFKLPKSILWVSESNSRLHLAYCNNSEVVMRYFEMSL